MPDAAQPSGPVYSFIMGCYVAVLFISCWSFLNFGAAILKRVIQMWRCIMREPPIPEGMFDGKKAKH